MEEQMGSVAVPTLSVTLTDASQLFSAAVDAANGSAVNWAQVAAALITCEYNDCRFAFGVAASTTRGHVLIDGQTARFPSADHILQARVINKIAGQNAVLQVTLEG